MNNELNEIIKTARESNNKIIELLEEHKKSVEDENKRSINNKIGQQVANMLKEDGINCDLSVSTDRIYFNLYLKNFYDFKQIGFKTGTKDTIEEIHNIIKIAIENKVFSKEHKATPNEIILKTIEKIYGETITIVQDFGIMYIEDEEFYTEDMKDIDVVDDVMSFKHADKGEKWEEFKVDLKTGIPINEIDVDLIKVPGIDKTFKILKAEKVGTVEKECAGFASIRNISDADIERLRKLMDTDFSTCFPFRMGLPLFVNKK